MPWESLRSVWDASQRRHVSGRSTLLENWAANSSSMMGDGLYIVCSTTQVSIHTHKHTHRLNSHREQFEFQYLARGHFDMWTSGAGDQTTDLPVLDDGSTHPEPHLWFHQMHHSLFFEKRIPEGGLHALEICIESILGGSRSKLQGADWAREEVWHTEKWQWASSQSEKQQREKSFDFAESLRTNLSMSTSFW